MRVLQVVAYVSSDGAYGGPVSVAFDQTSSLREADRSVTLAAGWDGAAQVPDPADLRLFRARRMLRSSFATLISPRLLWWALRRIRDFDVVHVHLARDLLTLPLALIAIKQRVPLVLQTHGMVQPDPRLIVRSIDRLLTRFVLRRAHRVLALTDKEVEGLRVLGVPASNIEKLINGAPPSEKRARWVEESPVVVFASRLASRKRPITFVQAAADVHRRRPDARFELWGPDEGEGAAVKAEIDHLGLRGCCRLAGAASPAAIRNLLSERQVFVLPSFEEPFPMALIESLSVGLPAVITNDTGLSGQCVAKGSAIVTDGRWEQVAEAIMRLLNDRETWQSTATAALNHANAELSMERVVHNLWSIYRRIAETARINGGLRP